MNLLLSRAGKWLAADLQSEMSLTLSAEGKTLETTTGDEFGKYEEIIPTDARIRISWGEIGEISECMWLFGRVSSIPVTMNFLIEREKIGRAAAYGIEISETNQALNLCLHVSLESATFRRIPFDEGNAVKVIWQPSRIHLLNCTAP